MKRNIRPFAFSAALALIVLGLIIYFLSANHPARLPTAAHFYKDSSKSIERINIKVFYAVPKDRAAAVSPDWRKLIETALTKDSLFHFIQFRGKSSLNFQVFPELVILNGNSFFYDTEITNRGNPRALIAVAEEIEQRVFTSSGDLYRADFAEKKDGSYPVMGIVYEGVGASGGVIFENSKESVEAISAELKIPKDYIFIVNVKSANGFFLISRQFLTGEEYKIFSASLVYHEFAHTFGLPDLYDLKTEAAYSNDVMGSGRRRPIENTFIDRETLKNLGVLE